MPQNLTDNNDYEQAVTGLAEQSAPRCIEFLHDLVTVPSPSRSERLACERVMREIPPKWIPPAHFGLPNLRQEISIDPWSLIYMDKRALRSPWQDRDRSPAFPKDKYDRRCA